MVYEWNRCNYTSTLAAHIHVTYNMIGSGCQAGLKQAKIVIKDDQGEHYLITDSNVELKRSTGFERGKVVKENSVKLS